MNIRDKAASLREELAKLMEATGVDIEELAVHMKRDLKLRGFSDTSFYRKGKIIINEKLPTRTVSELIKFYDCSIDALSDYSLNGILPNEDGNFTLEDIQNTNWEFYYYKKSRLSGQSGLFCAFLSIDNNLNKVTLVTQHNFYRGKIDLSYTGVIKFELSLKNLRPLLIMGNIGGITYTPDIFLANYINMSTGNRLVGGAGIVRRTTLSKSEVVRGLEGLPETDDNKEKLFLEAVRDYFLSYKKHYAKIGFASSVHDLRELNSWNKNRDLFS